MSRRFTARTVLAVVLGAAALTGGVLVAQDRFAAVQIKTTDLGGGLYLLEGQGGNMAVCAGDDAVFLVDDQFAPLAPKIRAAIAAISEKPVRFVFNTHYHGDHTGGNEAFGSTGSLIVAHENVRERMTSEQFEKRFGSAAAPEALPVVTFTDSVRFHLNGESIRAEHVPPAHTDGDSIVHFEKANVLHMGDLFFNGRYPFIDRDSGGDVAGYIAAGRRAAEIANATTKIVPGHGALSNEKELVAWLDLIEGYAERVREMVAAGSSWKEVSEAGITKETDAAMGTGFINPERFLRTLYDDAKAKLDANGNK